VVVEEQMVVEAILHSPHFAQTEVGQEVGIKLNPMAMVVDAEEAVDTTMAQEESVRKDTTEETDWVMEVKQAAEAKEWVERVKTQIMERQRADMADLECHTLEIITEEAEQAADLWQLLLLLLAEDNQT